MDNTAIFLTLLNCLFGTAGVFSFLLAYRKSKTDIFKVMQDAYRIFIEDTAREIGQLKEEIKMLHDVVKGYKETCDLCINNKKQQTK